MFNCIQKQKTDIPFQKFSNFLALNFELIKKILLKLQVQDLTSYMYKQACLTGARTAEKDDKKRAKLSMTSERCGVSFFKNK